MKKKASTKRNILKSKGNDRNRGHRGNKNQAHHKKVTNLKILTQRRNENVKQQVRGRNNTSTRKKGTTIEISNLSTQIQASELIQLFEQFGKITRMSIVWKKESNSCESRVTFEEYSAAKDAKNTYNKADLDSREILIRIM